MSNQPFQQDTLSFVAQFGHRQRGTYIRAGSPAQPSAEIHDVDEGDEFEDFDEDTLEYEEGEAEYEYIDDDEDVAIDDSTAADTSSSIPPHVKQTAWKRGEFVEVGVVGTAHGVRGGVNVQPFTDEPAKRFNIKGNRLWLQRPPVKGLVRQADDTSVLNKVTVQWGRPVPQANNRQKWVVKFDEVNDRNQAQTLQGQLILLAIQDRQHLRGSREFYVQDLVGCNVYLQDTGEFVGRVDDVFDGTGTYDTLSVQLQRSRQDILKSQRRSVLVPFAKEIVPRVDVKQRLVLIDPPQGLLDLVSIAKLRRPLSKEKQDQLLKELDANVANLDPETIDTFRRP